jgi:hypothetical protein
MATICELRAGIVGAAMSLWQTVAAEAKPQTAWEVSPNFLGDE